MLQHIDLENLHFLLKLLFQYELLFLLIDFLILIFYKIDLRYEAILQCMRSLTQCQIFQVNLHHYEFLKNR